MAFLPLTREEMVSLGWERPDFVLVSGDAYIDHPSFGAAVIGRVLEDAGFRVAVLAQPSHRDAADFYRFGAPSLAFLVTGGNVDSMVAHYTAARRLRSDDAYTPGNRAGRRPDRAVITYCRLIREAYPDCAIVIGGLEASLRRFAHYDYWDDRVRPSILQDSNADLLVYGMGESAVVEIARRLRTGEAIEALRDIRGTAYLIPNKEAKLSGYVTCPAYEKVARDKVAYARATALQYRAQDHLNGKTVVQAHGDHWLVQNPPAAPLAGDALDRVYELPYTYVAHPSYAAAGGVKAIEEVAFSLTHNRGCFGGCHFCSISFHQGRFVTARSHRSVLKEARKLTELPHFKGYIHDVGGPTANFRGPSCAKQEQRGLCADKRCLWPRPCPSLRADHRDYLALLDKLRRLPKVKKVFIRSGIRYDYVLADRDHTFIRALARHHVSGQLRVAPEHSVKKVLDTMGKPAATLYDQFCTAFYRETKEAGKEQYVVPYLIASHPGATLADAVELALWLRKRRLRPEQVQDFYPTPATIATAMYYTGLDPFTLQPVYVAKSKRERRLQRALLQAYKKENRPLVAEALRKVGRENLLDYLSPSSDGRRRGHAR